MDHKELENVISDYQWLKREVARLEELLWGIGGVSGGSKSIGVAQYGIEAAMPKGSKGISKAELDKLDRREKKILTRIEKYKNMIEFVELGEESLEDPIQQTVYSCMMAGMSYRAIGKHVGVSREKVRQLRDEVINQLCQNCHFCHSWQYLKYKKQTV
ncbi:sigma-70 family RNA polymerase sigma factor [Anaerobacillus sp. CMMVII]|uniref:sigma-70 family RNA polymerase sigma factor n=1 Tax=Anaerobacillus sp. CMMVII TaxID=2755588 RepID=UPI0021B7E28E|nr:sigma-70 family RNA polymerase sigma factor [Anaerobacillus sp. CMMVII]MCT8138631.1 sigma-70 family RNA polymerase sigma factor [Anaerobacillus sp. CMMVII]